MLESVGVACITIAVILELASYYKQIAKTLRTKNSAQVSSSAFMLKIIKYLFTLVGLGIFANWVGFFIEVLALVFCCVALYIIAKHKPKGWTLFNTPRKYKRLKKRSELR
ncbi:MAG: hypothetical protein V3U54_08975 [Thermodesulfobacteriota bacterium]